MAEYIADYEIFAVEERFRAGDLSEGRRLLRFYEAELARIAIARLRLVEELSAVEARAREPVYAEAEVIEETDSERYSRYIREVTGRS